MAFEKTTKIERVDVLPGGQIRYFRQDYVKETSNGSSEESFGNPVSVIINQGGNIPADVLAFLKEAGLVSE